MTGRSGGPGNPGDEPAILVTDLRKSYRGRPAVAGIDLTIGRGEVFALLGPNGAGKTTTVEILEGHRRRDSGRVRVLGVDPALGRPDWKARIGIVLQRSDDLTQGGALTVRDWTRAIAACFPNSRDPDEVIELVGLADRRNARAAHLSGGQRRRLDVALGIVGRPELLFLDEPTTGFDPEARRRFWDLIADLARSGTTILLTTHYLEEAEQLADRIAVLVAGRIVDIGPPQTLGGRATAPATVRWRSSDGPRSVRTGTPAKLVAELATEYGPDVPELAVERPSLEETYLRMIGEPA
ncbi:ABC transporter ATP-binding protein [Micromonospora sp. WMMD1102]|uniref:ABC transporter ATP-binding protein n=1 Tax=Micromonospora sp. WMMD1102 TaxID=3016105 RepID=UPI002414EFE5|nr:ABC transporter ATP-binding protein [Micromonospora sp. WMMD1102]MDG4787858.1 ABC transporter ATP-binding protein [Micromonospora sp. WMMD1102]